MSLVNWALLTALAALTGGPIVVALVTRGRRAARTPVDMLAIRASITTYRMSEGQEVGRRPAYPQARLALAIRAHGASFRAYGDAARGALAAAEGFRQAYEGRATHGAESPAP